MRILGKWLFPFVTCLYLFSAAGYVDCVDALPSIDAAHALATRASLSMPGRELEGTFYGKSPTGETYSLMGFTYPVLYIPAVVLGKGADSRLTYFFVSLVNPVLTAVLVLVIFMTMTKLGFSPRGSVWIALAMGFGTALFPYSKTCFREPLQALSLFSAWAFFLGCSSPARKYFISSAALAVGILTKEAFLIPALPLLAMMLFQASKEEKKAEAIVRTLLPVFGACCGWLALNLLAWGGLGNTGYSPEVTNLFGKAWETPFLQGVAMQWLSTENGFFLYNPLLLLSVPVLVVKWRTKTLDTVDVAVILTIALQTAFYARWYTPIGKEALGPRFLVTTIPLYVLFLRNVELKFPTWTWKTAVVVFVCFQLVNVSVKMQQYWTARARANSILTTPHWAANLKFFGNKIRKAPEIYQAAGFGGSPQTLDLSDAASLRGFNFWWAHLLRYHR